MAAVRICCGVAQRRASSAGKGLGDGGSSFLESRVLTLVHHQGIQGQGEPLTRRQVAPTIAHLMDYLRDDNNKHAL